MESISRTLFVLALFDSFLEHLDEISLLPLESYPSLPQKETPTLEGTIHIHTHNAREMYKLYFWA